MLHSEKPWHIFLQSWQALLGAVCNVSCCGIVKIATLWNGILFPFAHLSLGTSCWQWPAWAVHLTQKSSLIHILPGCTSFLIQFCVKPWSSTLRRSYFLQFLFHGCSQDLKPNCSGSSIGFGFVSESMWSLLLGYWTIALPQESWHNSSKLQMWLCHYSSCFRLPLRVLPWSKRIL